MRLLGKRLKKFAISILLIVFLVNLVKTIYQTYQAQERLQNLKAELEDLNTRKDDLLGQRDYKVSDAFIESEARNRLNLVKPGDVLVILKKETQEGDANIEVHTNHEVPPYNQWQDLLTRGLKSL